jgi:molecular chaperone GrpE
MSTESNENLPQTQTGEPVESETDAPVEVKILDAEVLDAEEEPTEPSAKELFERLQRVSADFANYQKRVARDKAKWSQDAQRSLIRDLLPVLDTLDSAIASFGGEVKDVGTYQQGVELVREELMRQLGKHKVSKVHAEVGGPYDLDAHEAIMVQEDEEVDSKVVAFVARAGYRLGDAVLRAAQVGVKQPKS